MEIQVIKIKGAYQVVWDQKVHAVYTFSSLSKISETMAKVQAHGFVQGYRYANR